MPLFLHEFPPCMQDAAWTPVSAKNLCPGWGSLKKRNSSQSSLVAELFFPLAKERSHMFRAINVAPDIFHALNRLTDGAVPGRIFFVPKPAGEEIRLGL